MEKPLCHPDPRCYSLRHQPSSGSLATRWILSLFPRRGVGISMPRLPPSLFRRASDQSPYLAALLPACKDLPSARSELRWIRDDVARAAWPRRRRLLARLCRLRGRGVPLQYLLGSQPFGPLDILCRPGVLIPRPETEAYTCHLVDRITAGDVLGRRAGRRDDGLRILDLCTGTGCIPLLLFSSLQQLFPRLHVLGVDVSPEAVQLADDNIAHNTALGHIGQADSGMQTLEMSRADIFNQDDMRSLAQRPWDILTCNPPYVSEPVWDYGRGQLAYSVRKYEPRLALVPGRHLAVPEGWRREDIFYRRILELAAQLRPRLLLLEFGDDAQARRILAFFCQLPIARQSRLELWREWPDGRPARGEDHEPDRLKITTPLSCGGGGGGSGWEVPVRGRGRLRAMMIYLADGAEGG